MTPPDHQPDKKTILVIDDTAFNLTLMSGVLKKWYTVKEAASGASPATAQTEALPDLILLDIMMPLMDGYEVCRAA